MSVADGQTGRHGTAISEGHACNIASSRHCYRLIPLKTTTELRAGDELVDVYITQVPHKSASSVLKYGTDIFGQNMWTDYLSR